MKPVFGGFETRHKFIKFGHWYQPGFFDKVLNTSKSRPVQGKVWVPIIKSEFGSHFPKVNNPHPSSAWRTPRMLNRIAIAKSIITRYQSAENWKLNWTQTYFSFMQNICLLSDNPLFTYIYAFLKCKQINNTGCCIVINEFTVGIISYWRLL